MKINQCLCIVMVLVNLILPGCSSIRARDAAPAAAWTVYPGVRQDVTEMGEIVTGQRREALWVQALVATLLIADLPFSVTFDTLAMPYDLYRKYTSQPQQTAP